MLSLPDFKQKQVVIALLSHGERLSFKNDNIIIQDQDGKIKHQSTCYRLFALFIVGHMSITTGLLQRSKKFGFSIVFLTHGLTPYGGWLSRVEGNTLLRQKQYSYNKIDIAQHLIKNKIAQQILMLNLRRDKSDKLKNAILKLQEYNERMPDSTLGLRDVLGLEGVSSRLYFSHMFDNIDWRGRTPRTKKDIVNLLLDIGYTQLFNLMDAMLNLYGFDTYKGVYHREFYQRKSLVSDLVEPFRPIVDYRIRKAFNLGQINEDDFDVICGQYRLFGNASKPYVSLLLQNLLEHKNEMFLYVQNYYRAFMQDKPIDQYPIFTGGGKE